MPAGVGVLGPVDEPGAERGDGGGGQEATAARGFGEFGDGEAGDVAESGFGEEGGVVPGDLGDELVGDPVEDADEGGVVFLGGAQEVPGDGVGVAGGGGDHHPDVGGGDEFGGEQAVAGDQGVDVGGVQEGEAAGRVGAVSTRRTGVSVRPVSSSSSRSGPGRPPWCRVGCGIRARPGRTRPVPNQWWSSGWQTRTGVRVVGRRTPASLTCRPTRELTRVDLPAPVEPPMTARRGASGARRRGSR